MPRLDKNAEPENDRLDEAPAGGVPHPERRTAGRRPSVAPLPHGSHDVPQIPALLGEAVLRAGRMVLVGHSVEHTVVDQTVQPLGEDVARDPEAGLQVFETGHAQNQGIRTPHIAPRGDDALWRGLQRYRVALLDGAIIRPQQPRRDAAPSFTAQQGEEEAGGAVHATPRPAASTCA